MLQAAGVELGARGDLQCQGGVQAARPLLLQEPEKEGTWPAGSPRPDSHQSHLPPVQTLLETGLDPVSGRLSLGVGSPHLSKAERLPAPEHTCCARRTV